MSRAVLLGLALAAGCAPSAYVEPLPKEAVHYRATTAGGWSLSMVRYRPAEPRGRPVLLLHGICANGRNMDLDAGHSMARWFAAHGREAWTLSLRGLGESDRADPKAGRDPGFSFDAFWQEDLPAAIALVQREAGAPSIDFVGHSMGGMIFYAYLSQGGQGVGAAAVLGSPTRLDWGGPLDPMIPVVASALDGRWMLPSGMGALWPAGASYAMRGTPLQFILYEPANTSEATWRRMLASGTDDVSAAVTQQLSAMVRTGFFGSADGKIDFRRDLAKVRTPILVVAGKADRIGSVPAVKDGYRLLGGPKEWLIAGEENGAAADYAHMDLVIGERAPAEVWPKVLDFLDRHGG